MEKDQLNNLLRILKLTGGKFVIVEQGEPVAVLMSYKEFEDLTVPKIASELMEQLSRIEDINKQITSAQMVDLREEVIDKDNSEEIRIEPIDPI